MNNSISFGKTFSQGFNLFGKTLGWQILLSIVAFFITLIAVLLFSAIAGYSSPFIMPLAYLAIFPIFMGFAIINDQSHRGENINFGGAFVVYKKTLGITGLYIITSIVSTLILIGVAYLTMGDALPAILEGYAELIQVMQTNPMETQYIVEDISYLMMESMVGYLIAVLVTAAISILFILSPFYLVLKNLSFGEAFVQSIKVGAKNLPVILAILIVLYLIVLVVAMIPFLGVLVLMFTAVPLFHAFMYTMFRQLEPVEQEDNNPNREDILDV